MKNRTFFVMLTLFMVFLYSVILMISLITLRDQLSAVKEKCMAEHYVIASALIKDMQALEQRETDIEKGIDSLMRPYTRYLQSQKGGLAVAFSREWIYQACDVMPKDSAAGLKSKSEQERVVYMENADAPILCVYGNFPAPWQNYGLLYVGDLSDTLASWRQMTGFLFLTGMAVVALMAVFTYQFLNRLFRPLEQISSISEKIADGDYERRLSVRGRDEAAQMAQNFNRMAEQVEAQIRQLQESADQKQQFIDNFAHELRIPLTAMYGYAEYIQRASISEEERYECTEFIMSECKRLQNMAYQLLDLALLREIDMEDCPIAQLFMQSEKSIHARAEEKGVACTYLLKDGANAEKPGEPGAVREGLTIRGNREQLLMLLNNLVDNALKASPPEGRVMISACAQGDHVVIEVRDEGIGIGPEQLAHIKEAFYRVDKARSRADGGAGLGLSICERIARLHGAELSFASEPGLGTTARLCFPKPVKN